MENIRPVVAVQMSNFWKQAELGGERLLGAKQFLDSCKLSFQSIDRETPVLMPYWDLVHTGSKPQYTLMSHSIRYVI